MALFHELQQKETLTFGMCFTEELFSIWIKGLLFPDCLISIQRGYYRERDIMVHYPQTWYKNNHGNVLSTL